MVDGQGLVRFGEVFLVAEINHQWVDGRGLTEINKVFSNVQEKLLMADGPMVGHRPNSMRCLGCPRESTDG
jgi:hypothetical protein